MNGADRCYNIALYFNATPWHRTLALLIIILSNTTIMFQFQMETEQIWENPVLFMDLCGIPMTP